MSGKQPEIISGLAILKTGENLDHPYFVWEQTHESSEQQVWFWLDCKKILQHNCKKKLQHQALAEM